MSAVPTWRDHPFCQGRAPWPERFWGPEALDPDAWSSFAGRLDPTDEVATLIAAIADGPAFRPGSGLPPGPIVDVGGGTGLLTQALAARFGSCVVVEPSQAQLAAAPAGLICVRGRGEALPIGDAAARAAVATWVLQYTGDPWATVAELARITAPGGRVLLVQAAPENDLVDIYNAEAAAAGVAAAHHGWLLAGAAEILGAAGFSIEMSRVPVVLRAAASEAVVIAEMLARLHFAGHPRRTDIVAASLPVVEAALAREPCGLCDDGIVLTATRLR